MKTVNNKLRVNHYPQMSCEPFIVDVDNEYEAKKIIEVLAQQHLWLYDQNIIDDYSNIIYVSMFDEDENEWVDYWNDEESMDFDELEEAYLGHIKVINS